MSETTETKTRAPKAPAGLLDPAAGTVTFGEDIYEASTLPSVVQAYLLVLGLRTDLTRGPNKDAAYQALAEGEVPKLRTAPGEKAKRRGELSPVRQAIVTVMLARAKKRGEVLAQADAETTVRGLTRQQAEAYGRDEAVARALAKLLPAPSLDALLPGAQPAAEAA